MLNEWEEFDDGAGAGSEVASFLAVHGRAGGSLLGKQLQPREIAELAVGAGFHEYEAVKAVATCLSESQGFAGAFNDNESGGEVTSRDCGLWQINIPASEIGTTIESGLRTETRELLALLEVAQTNVAAARRLYLSPGPNQGQRRFNPWVAYIEGWSTFPEWWVWHQDATGRPIGPWMRTGRYVQRAIAGLANYHLVSVKDWDAGTAIEFGHRMAAHFRVKGSLFVGLRSGLVTWTAIPTAPTAPPQDGVGPRPKANHGL